MVSYCFSFKDLNVKYELQHEASKRGNVHGMNST